jgi:tetratricopeptide (TPR) repeat protein
MLEEGDQIRDYTLKKFLGQGSYGDVWLAEKRIELADECIPFALKFLTGQSGKGINIEGVRNEVKTWIKAGNHFNIVPVYDGFTHRRFLVIVSEYIEGGSLRDWLVSNEKKASSLEKAVKIMQGILQGLTHLHSRKIIHRDLKPENILLKDGIPKITDFGVSRMVETFSQSTALRYTKGAGAPLYMPPEAFSDGNPMPQLDTWSAGVMFYEMLSGEFPFNADSLPALLGEITNKEPKPLPSYLPDELHEFVSISLAKDVSQRFQTSEEMGVALEKAWAETEQRRKWRLETIGDDVRLERNARQREASGKEYQDQQDKEQERFKNSAVSQSEVEEVNDLPKLVVKRSAELPTKEAKQEQLEEVQRNESRQKRFRKLNRIVIAALVLAVIIGGVIWLSTKRLVGTNSQNAEALISRGRECYEKKDYDCAIGSFTKAIDSNPDSAEIYTNRGKAYFGKGDYDQAIKDFSKAIELKPKYADPYTFRGAAYGAKGNPDKAIEDINRAIELNPQFPEAYFNRGLANRDKGNSDQAIKDFDKAIELNPKRADAYYERGLTYSTGGNRDQAIKDFDKAIELNPQSGDGYSDRGAAYLFEGNIDQAIKDLDRAIEINPKLAAARYYRGLAYGNKGNNDQAMRDFSMAIELNPQMAEAYAYRGTAYSNKGDFDQAVRDFNKAIELNPQMVEAYHNRGLAYGNRGNHNQAIIDFSKAIELNPQYAPAYYYRALSYERLGQAAKARVDAQRFKELSVK